MKKKNVSNELKVLGQRLGHGRNLSKRLYTAPELIRLTGMSRKQVEYWAKIKLLKPKVQKSTAKIGQAAYFYSALDVVKALIICELRQNHFSLRQVQVVARNLEEHGLRLEAPDMYLLTDGYSVYYANNKDEVIDTLKHNRQRLMLIPIQEQIRKLIKVA